MKLASYIDEEFLNEIDEVFNTPQLPLNINVHQTFVERFILQYSIIATLWASEIITNLSEKECIKYFKNSQDPTKPFSSQSWKEKIIYQAISNEKFKRVNVLSFSDPNGVYFIKNATQEDKNVAVINEFKNCNKYFSTKTGSLTVDKFMNGVDGFKHTANALLIYDPYFFIDTPGREPKIPNVIKLLQTIIQNNETTYYLSIVAKDQRSKDERYAGLNHNELIYLKLDTIKNALPNLIISAFVPFENIFGSNRHLFTNYFYGFNNHLFDREANLNVCFLFRELNGTQRERSDRISNNYVEFNEKIDRIKDSFRRHDSIRHGQEIKFGDILQNPLFA